MTEPPPAVDVWEVATARLREAQRLHWLLQRYAPDDTAATLQALSDARADVTCVLAWVRDLDG